MVQVCGALAHGSDIYQTVIAGPTRNLLHIQAGARTDLGEGTEPGATTEPGVGTEPDATTEPDGGELVGAAVNPTGEPGQGAVAKSAAVQRAIGNTAAMAAGTFGTSAVTDAVTGQKATAFDVAEDAGSTAEGAGFEVLAHAGQKAAARAQAGPPSQPEESNPDEPAGQGAADPSTGSQSTTNSSTSVPVPQEAAPAAAAGAGSGDEGGSKGPPVSGAAPTGPGDGKNPERDGEQTEAANQPAAEGETTAAGALVATAETSPEAEVTQAATTAAAAPQTAAPESQQAEGQSSGGRIRYASLSGSQTGAAGSASGQQAAAPAPDAPAESTAATGDPAAAPPAPETHVATSATSTVQVPEAEIPAPATGAAGGNEGPPTTPLSTAGMPDPGDEGSNGDAEQQAATAPGAEAQTIAVAPAEGADEQVAGEKTTNSQTGENTSARSTIPTVRIQLAEANGDVTPSSGGLRKRFAGLLRGSFDAQAAGYSGELNKQLAGDLKSLPVAERGTVARQLNNLSPEENDQIQTLLDQVTPAGADGTTQEGGVELQEALLTRIASLSSEDRGQVLSNMPSEAQQADASSQFDALSQFIAAAPGDDDTKAEFATFALAFPSQERGQAMGLTNTVVELGSNPGSPLSIKQQAKLDDAIDSLQQLAAKNGVSKTLARIADPFGSTNDYNAVAEKLESLFKAAAAGSTGDEATGEQATKDLHLVIQTGARGLDSNGNLKASMHGGAEGAAQLNRFLRVMADRYGVNLKVTMVTDGLNAPVVQKVNRALGIYDIDDIDGINNKITGDDGTNNPRTININTTHPTHVATVPSGRWSVADRTKYLKDLNPDAVISVGHSANNGGAKSLMEPANDLGKPTIAFAGHYDQDGSALATLNAAKDGLEEDTPDMAVAKLLINLADRQNVSQKGEKGDFKSNLPSVYRVSKAYEAYEGAGAISDDGRIAEGISNNTLTVGGRVGQRNLLYHDYMGVDSTLEAPRESTGLEQFAAGYQGPSAQAQMERINQLHESAQPGVSAKDQFKSMPFLYSQATSREKLRLAGFAGASLAGTYFIGKEAVDFFILHDGISAITNDRVNAIGALATSIRQAWITRVASLERAASIRGVASDPKKQRANLKSFGSWMNDKIDRSMANDPEADAFNNKRRAGFVTTGFLSYPLSMAVDLYAAAHPGHESTVGESILRGAALMATGGLGLVDAQYTREVLTMRMGPDGKVTATPGFEPGRFGKAVDIARIPLAISGAANIANIIGWAHAGFNWITTIPNYARNETNINKAVVVWTYQRRQDSKLIAADNKDGARSRLFEWVDGTIATNTGTWPTMEYNATSFNPEVENQAASIGSLFVHAADVLTHVVGGYASER